MLNIWCVPRHRHCSCSASVGKQNLASITLICSLQLFPFLLLCSILLFEMFAPVVVVGVVACRLSSFPHPSVSALSSSSSSSSFRRRRALIVFSCLFPRSKSCSGNHNLVKIVFVGCPSRTGTTYINWKGSLSDLFSTGFPPRLQSALSIYTCTRKRVIRQTICN